MVCVNLGILGLYNLFYHLKDAVSKRSPGSLAAAYLFLNGPPVAGHVRLFKLVRQYPVKFSSEYRRAYLFALAFNKAAGLEIIYYRRTGRGGSDAPVFALLFFVLCKEQLFSLRIRNVFCDPGHVLV